MKCLATGIKRRELKENTKQIESERKGERRNCVGCQCRVHATGEQYYINLSRVSGGSYNKPGLFCPSPRY
jgi:hypothetical protein